MRDPIPPGKSELQIAKVLESHPKSPLKLGLDQRGRVALYTSKDRWLCHLDADSVAILEQICYTLKFNQWQHLTDSERQNQ